MRTLVAAACLVLLATGCRTRDPAPPTGTASRPIAARPVADPRAEMIGQWTVDVDRLPEQANFARMPEKQRALALEMARNMLTSMTVRFEEHSYAITTGGKTVSGTWRVVSRRGSTLELELIEAGENGEAPTMEKMVLQVDSRGLIMTAADDEALPLRRKVDASAADGPGG